MQEGRAGGSEPAPDQVERVHATVHVVVGERVRARRVRRGWRQRDLADAMRRDAGLNWLRVTVAAVERGEREVHLIEQAALVGLFHLDSWTQFLEAGEEGLQLDGRVWAEADVVVEIDEGARYHWLSVLESLRGGMLGWGLVGGGPALQHDPDEAETKAARSLGVPVPRVRELANHLWRQPLARERDVRLGDIDDVPARTVQARRGHITRTLLAELRGELDVPTAGAGRRPADVTVTARPPAPPLAIAAERPQTHVRDLVTTPAPVRRQSPPIALYEPGVALPQRPAAQPEPEEDAADERHEIRTDSGSKTR